MYTLIGKTGSVGCVGQHSNCWTSVTFCLSALHTFIRAGHASLSQCACSVSELFAKCKANSCGQLGIVSIGPHYIQTDTVIFMQTHLVKMFVPQEITS